MPDLPATRSSSSRLRGPTTSTSSIRNTSPGRLWLSGCLSCSAVIRRQGELGRLGARTLRRHLVAGLTNWRWLHRFWHSGMGVAPATWQFAELLLVCEAAGVKADQAEPEFAASIGELTAIKKAAAPRPTSQARHGAEATRPRARAFLLLQRAPTEESWATKHPKAARLETQAEKHSTRASSRCRTAGRTNTRALADVLVSYWASHRRCATSSSIDRWGVVAPNSRLWQVPT